MNPWTIKSIKLANSPRYLDKLQAIYTVTKSESREIHSSIKGDIATALKSNRKKNLLALLFSLEKFPIKDPYVAFLKKDPKFLELNPKTVERIFNTLKTIGLKEIISGIEEPKEFNRRMGSSFHSWVHTIGYPILSMEKFDTHKNGIALLEGSGTQLRKYAEEVLGCKLDKNPDVLARNGKKFALGEAKFLTDYGGHQDTQLRDALSLLDSKEKKVVRIAILDGVVWINRNVKMHNTVKEINRPVFSALLLGKFLESLN